MIKIDGLYVPDDEGYWQKHAGALEDYQIRDRLYAFEFVTDWSLAIDLGANIGIFSRHFSQRFERVIAVEPIAQNVECLRKNVPANVDIIEAAVGDEVGLLSMYRGRKSGSHSYAFHPEVENPVDPLDDSRIVEVPVITIDSLNLQSCGLIKMDIQGCEILALRGAAETIKRCRPVMLIEEKPSPSGSGQHIKDTAALLQDLGMVPKGRAHADRTYAWV